MSQPNKKSRAELCDEAETMLRNGTAFPEIRAYLKTQTSDEEIAIIMPIVNRNQLRQVEKEGINIKSRSLFYFGLAMAVLGVIIFLFLLILFNRLDIGIILTMVLAGILIMAIGMKGFGKQSK